MFAVAHGLQRSRKRFSLHPSVRCSGWWLLCEAASAPELHTRRLAQHCASDTHADLYPRVAVLDADGAMLERALGSTLECRTRFQLESVHVTDGKQCDRLIQATLLASNRGVSFFYFSLYFSPDLKLLKLEVQRMMHPMIENTRIESLNTLNTGSDTSVRLIGRYVLQNVQCHIGTVPFQKSKSS